MDGIIKHAVLYRSNTNHFHAAGDIWESRFPDGHDVITSRIIKAWIGGDEQALMIQTKHSVYALPLNTLLATEAGITAMIAEIDEEFGG